MRRLVALAVAPVALTFATVAAERGWPARLPLHLSLFLLAGLAWALALVLLPRVAGPVPPTGERRQLWAILAIAIVMRVPAWLSAPAHSDDVYRYAWDGRVTRAGINPYRYAPADPELAFLRDGVRLDKPEFEREPARPTSSRGPLWARINNNDLPTIYPPASQLAFLVAALLPLGPVAALKLLLALCDLAIVALLFRLLRRRGDDPRWAIAWAWCPLVVVEIAGNAHVDALAILLLVGALDAWQSRRTWLAGILLGAATATKLITAPLVLSLRSWRTWLATAATVLALALPFLGARASLVGSTGEFARRWRSNDGAYALLQAMSDTIVCRTLHAPRVPRDGPGPECTQALDLWPDQTVVRIVTGRSYRYSMYPDEISSFCARMASAAVLGLVLLFVAVRRKDALEGTEWSLGALLLFTPALHPWYALWVLPLVALRRRWGWAALAALAPFGYAPLAAWLGGAPWRDPVWTRVVEHGACWSLLGLQWALGRRRRAPQ